ncbi:unnamed protein product [Merluccius merluccius]
MGQWALQRVTFLLVLSLSGGRIYRARTRFTVVAPDLLRADSQENIYLEASGLPGPVRVSIYIRDFSKSTVLFEDSFTLGPEHSYHMLRGIQVMGLRKKGVSGNTLKSTLSSVHLMPEEHKNKFVYLTVNFHGYHEEERVMMVSFQQGYIFIQTEKPIYNPGDTVRIRAYVSSPSFKAFNSTLRVEFQDPEGMVVKQIFQTMAVDGVRPESFTLYNNANEGMWAVIAKFDHRPENTFRAPFQVKKYVLPPFNVTLVPRSSYLSLDQTQLEVEVSASYLYGEPVQGTAYVVFGLEIDNQMKRLPSVKQVSDLEGGVATLTMEEIRRAYPDLRSLLGKSVYVKASVLTNSGSDLVEATKTGIRIVDSPYILTFSDLPKYFKPGPFDFTIQLNYQDGSPASDVPVRVDLIDDLLPTSPSGSLRVSVNMPKTHQPQTIRVATAAPGQRTEQQAREEATVLPYLAFSRRHPNFLYISGGSDGQRTAGKTLTLTLTPSLANSTHRQLITHVTYLVLSKGKILQAKRLSVGAMQSLAVTLRVSQEMKPSFRVVAYYTLPWRLFEEVVSDSIWVDLDDGCVGGLSVGPMGGHHRDLVPGTSFRFNIRGDPGAKVNLVAVDNAVYLLSKQRLTQSKIWRAVEKGDMGCTRGGGRDGLRVFTDAGLLFASSSGAKTSIRQVLKCPVSARRRRSAELLKRRAQLEAQYQEELQQRCCRDGLRDVAMPYSCTRRSLYITEGWECIRAFRYCCAHLRGQVLDTSRPTTPPPLTTTPPPPPPTTTTPPPSPTTDPLSSGRILHRHDIGNELVVETVMLERVVKMVMLEDGVMLEEAAPLVEDEEGGGGEDEGQYLTEYDVYLRDNFVASWLWQDVDLPRTPDGRDGLASVTMLSALPDSITEWSIMAISASPDTGFCVAKPYNVRARKDFFVDLKLPHSVARHEQIQIKAVKVVLMVTEGMCSVAFNEKHTQEVDLAAGGSVVVPYTIMPLVVGSLPVQVMVLGRGMTGGDRVEKILRVVVSLFLVPESGPRSSVSSEGRKRELRAKRPMLASLLFILLTGNQTIRLHKVELESVVPKSRPQTYIYIKGNVLADSIDNSISDDSLAALIRMPGGCVEQNLASIILPLIATLYLDRTQGWESVGVQRKAEALTYITRGYEKQLAYRKHDGSYPPYMREGSSTWVTAFVVKVFSMAYSLVKVEEQQVCEALLYLLNNKQQEDGSFREDNPVYSTTMTGGLRGGEAKTTLTAFVLIALAEARGAGVRCSGNSEDRAGDYLRRQLQRKRQRPYTVAISAYALTLLGTDPRYDPTRPLLRALSATGYGLLALLKSGRLQEAAAPFNWLNSQRRRGGGYGSTQPTMVVLQALSEYLVLRPPGQDTFLQVDLKVPGRTEMQFRFEPQTDFSAPTIKAPLYQDFDVEAREYRYSTVIAPLDQEFEVEARGNGQGILEVAMFYNQLHEVEEKVPCPHFELEVATEVSSEKPPADVIKSHQITIRVRARGPMDVRMVVLDISLPTGFTPDHSDLERLSNSVDHYISHFQVVDNLSDRGSLIIHLFKVSHKEPEILIFRLQQNFNVGLLQPSSVTVYEYYNPDHRCSRTYSAAEDTAAVTHICRNDVCRCTEVYKVKLLNVNQSSYDTYEMEITQVIKHGLEADVEAGASRLFMSHGGCRDHLHLQQGSHYFIMGTKQDVWQTDDSFVYMLGKKTWVERWPSAAECTSNAALQAKCTSLEGAVAELTFSGCRQ